MRQAGARVRGDNTVVRRITLWSAAEMPKAEAGRIIRVGLQRAGEPIWLARFDQTQTGLAANSPQNLGPSEDLNYPCQDGDTVIAEYEDVGSPTDALEVRAIVELHRVGAVSDRVIESGAEGMPGARDVTEPVFHDPDRRSRRLQDQLNRSGVLSNAVTIALSSGSGGGGNGGGSTFLALPDTPSTYEGMAGHRLEVNEGEDALIFVPRPRLLHVRDEKPNGTAGGTFSSGQWRHRDLNKVMVNEIPGASLDAGSGEFTLPPGTYFLDGRAPAFDVNRHKALIANLTDSIDQVIGASCAAYNDGSECHMVGQFSITQECDFVIRHRSSSSNSGDGFGVPSNFGPVEVYSEVLVWQLRV